MNTTGPHDTRQVARDDARSTLTLQLFLLVLLPAGCARGAPRTLRLNILEGVATKCLLKVRVLKMKRDVKSILTNMIFKLFLN